MHQNNRHDNIKYNLHVWWLSLTQLTCSPGILVLIKLHAFSLVDFFLLNMNKTTTNSSSSSNGDSENKMNETFFFRFSLPMAVYRFIWIFSFACHWNCEMAISHPVMNETDYTQITFHILHTHVRISMKMWTHFKHFGKWVKEIKRKEDVCTLFAAVHERQQLKEMPNEHLLQL